MPFIFCLLKPHFLSFNLFNTATFPGFIFPLHTFENFLKTELAAATLIC